jgi:hypothetical protein
MSTLSHLDHLAQACTVLVVLLTESFALTPYRNDIETRNGTSAENFIINRIS